MRTFDTGATRDNATGKLEYARFLDVRVLRRFAEYMHVHRQQKDGVLREPDNWKKGIARRAYVDSLYRHAQDLLELYDYGECVRPETGEPVELQETICAILFNAMGLLYEILRGRDVKEA